LFKRFEKPLDPSEILVPGQRLVRCHALADVRRGPALVGEHANVAKPAKILDGLR
jgi:hypothetical protein